MISNEEKIVYEKRLIDENIEKYLKIFGAISIEGPKWCGKTTTAEHFSNDKIYFSDRNTRELARTDFDYVLKDNYPILIDEWQLVPSIWDEVRNRCDRMRIKGGYILTGSTTLNHATDSEDERNKVYHSGAGRFAIVKMYPMSLYESKDSSGVISLMDMYNGVEISKRIEKSTLTNISKLIIRGGWPENIKVEEENQDIIPTQYINAILTTDIHEGNKRRNTDKMRMILKSLARNESTLATLTTISKDINEENEIIKDVDTIKDYISVLKDLYLIEDIPAYNINYRSSKRVGATSKRHFVDPSLASSLLELDTQKLVGDTKTFGYMFESLVARDLRIYIEHLGGNIFHFRDNQSGDEVDIILEFKGGEYAAIEVKSNMDSLDKAKTGLLTFYENVKRKPKFMAIIIAECEIVYKDKDTGIYILPLTALKP